MPEEREAAGDRPRQYLADVCVRRLLRHGPKLLSGNELLTLVLGPDLPAAGLQAAGLLDHWQSLTTLATARPEALVKRAGLSWEHSIRLVAAFELGARGCQAPSQRGMIVRAAADLRAILIEEFRGCKREHFLALYLDTRHRLGAVETVSIGSLNASLVHPREVFRPAISWGAAAVIVAHNHPSGCVRPSGEDRELTARLNRCGRLLGIELLDHIIVAGGQILSLRENDWPADARPQQRAVTGTEG